jgi:hypothetical protein
VPLSAVPSLMAQVAALRGALARRLAAASITHEASTRDRAPESERLLTPPEAAALPPRQGLPGVLSLDPPR